MRLLKTQLWIVAAWLLTLPGYLTTLGNNELLNSATRGEAIKAWMKYVGLFKSLHEEALTSATTSGSKLNMTGAKGKGYVNEKVVVFAELNGKTTKGEAAAGLTVGAPYFVVTEETEGFAVSLTRGGSAITPSAEVKPTTKIVLLEELPETPYARVATAFGSAAGGESTDTEKVIKVPASTTITYAGWWEKSTKAGETHANEVLFAVEKLENSETFTGAGEYKLTSDKLEANPIA
jgi:hypothetical protein